MSKNRAGNTQTATHMVVTAPITKQTCTPPSIRKLCMEGILAGKTTAEIAEQIRQFHPTSMAAEKSKKHIAWYRATMKKAGQLPAQPATQLDA